MRALPAIEVAVIVAASITPWPVPIPIAVPLLVVASVSLWLRGRSWAEVSKGSALHAAVGAGAGVLALVLAIAGTPLAERVMDDVVQWSTYPIVRGSWSSFAVVAIVVGVGAIATELVLRGWIVERVLELGGHRVLAILVGAIVEGMITGGDIAIRIGAGLFGIGLGWMYLAGGRSVVAPMCARLAFAFGALVLETMRVIG